MSALPGTIRNGAVHCFDVPANVAKGTRASKYCRFSRPSLLDRGWHAKRRRKTQHVPITAEFADATADIERLLAALDRC